MKKIFGFLTLIALFSQTALLFYPLQGGQCTGTVYAVPGGTPTQTVTETIDYAYKVEDEYYNPYELPGYLSTLTCGISAGGVAIGHYDRIYEELIPNHTGKTLLGKWFYASQDSEVNTMFSSLYTAMGATSQGVTLNGYLTGMSSYVSGKGRTVSFTQTMSGSGILNVTQYKAAINSGKLLSIFLNDFSILDLGNYHIYPGQDIVTSYISTGAHIMIAYGYYDVSYYNSYGQCFRQDSYLYTSTGYSTPMRALLKTNDYCFIDDCYITYVY